ncbi:lycopene cyclase family protein [Streptomyces longispororuber]|uniref:lycopene cyclase family protein n=1 Tax=Streptomyces longispororuber TaxID=68230 RepID=UPI0037027CB2
MPQWDVAVVGAGAAGLSLAHRLAGHATGLRTPSVVLIDAPPGPLRPPPRTWCHWAAGPGRFDAAVSAQWHRVRVRPHGGAAVSAADGDGVVRDISPLRYRMIRSDDFERLVLRDLARSTNVHRLQGTVDTVRDGPDGAQVCLRDTDGAARVLDARWVFDSRPPTGLPAARTLLLQHFHGWFVHTARPVFDPATVELMDFRTPQPAHGLSFGYVLPLTPHEALVEYTEFSARPLTPPAYEAAVRHYADDVLRLGERRVSATETGVIPMSDAPLPRRAGESVFRIGVAGGATRPATGYTFAAIQRQARAVARALREGRRPVPPTAHSARSRAMDAVLLRALDSGRVDGPELFTRLFARVPGARLLRFLDGDTRLHEDLAIGLRTPAGPMLRSALDLPRLRRRPFAVPAAPHPPPHPAHPPRTPPRPATSPLPAEGPHPPPHPADSPHTPPHPPTETA